MPPPTLRPPTLQRPWQPLPRLPTNGQSQAYSRQKQLEQLLQIHRELEHVEKGLLHQKANETPDSSSLTLHRLGDHPHELPMELSHSTEELPGHVFTPSGQFSQPILLNNPPTGYTYDLFLSLSLVSLCFPWSLSLSLCLFLGLSLSLLFFVCLFFLSVLLVLP